MPSPLMVKVEGAVMSPAVVKSPSETVKVLERFKAEPDKALKSPPELVKVPVTFITELVGRVKVPADLVKVLEKVEVAVGAVKVPADRTKAPDEKLVNPEIGLVLLTVKVPVFNLVKVPLPVRVP